MSDIADKLRAVKDAYAESLDLGRKTGHPVFTSNLMEALAGFPDPDAMGLYIKESQNCIRQLEDMHHLWKDFGGDDGQGHFEGEHIIGSMVGRAKAALAKLEEKP